MRKQMDLSNLANLATDPIMDKVVGTLVDTSTPKKASEPKKKSNTATKKKASVPKPKSKQEKIEPTATSSDEKVLYNYRKEELDIEGVGKVQKVISEKGRIIGRPNKATKEKKKPITLTLPPALYDLVKENASADHRTTSEYLAMIIEDYFNK